MITIRLDFEITMIKETTRLIILVQKTSNLVPQNYKTNNKIYSLHIIPEHFFHTFSLLFDTAVILQTWLHFYHTFASKTNNLLLFTKHTFVHL